ncbi:hypothetical protein [Cellulomonas cellasea]|uniref:Uncharacterized protein n=1 Tax=Cellulomonas cellasea TaxID=43670 RepID=A0A7W4UF97_9CELL|nr:hypothetical protein [Cellulomonas cellasea]MBB2923116.1 hypothetical protein [Cellulomonas cellasea]
MELSAVWAVVGALIGAAGTFLGVVVTQRETLRRELQLRRWQDRAEAYVDLVRWTAWVEHWYIVGAPDKYERPRTVEMARTAARITAFGDDETGSLAYELLRSLSPHVSGQDISGRRPPPDGIRVDAGALAKLARDRLVRGAGEPVS